MSQLYQLQVSEIAIVVPITFLISRVYVTVRPSNSMFQRRPDLFFAMLFQHRNIPLSARSATAFQQFSVHHFVWDINLLGNTWKHLFATLFQKHRDTPPSAMSARAFQQFSVHHFVWDFNLSGNMWMHNLHG